MSDPRPIGIFDSGIGGLTVLAEVCHTLPQESIIYLGDTARVPYGIRSAKTIVRYSLECCQFLVQLGVKAIVVACNTASTHALGPLVQAFSLPVLGVVEPGIAAVFQDGVPRSVGVIGTNATIQSHVYRNKIGARNPQTKVVEIACPLFVPLVEEGWLEGEITEAVIRKYLAPLQRVPVERLILGCTHYPLLKGALQKVLGSSIPFIDSAEEVAKMLQQVLKQKLLLSGKGSKATTKIYVTDLPQKFEEIAHRFLAGDLPAVENIQLTV